MIKIVLTKNDKFLNLSSLIDKKTKNKSSFNICLSVNCHTNVVDDLVESGISECDIIFNLEADSNLKYSFSVNHKLSIISRDLTVNLLGQSAKADLNIKIASLKEQQINLVTKQIHLSSYTSSFLNIKNVMLKNSKFHCDNLIKIEKDLSDVTAIETSKVLSLVSDALAIFKPRIEVDSQDVICKHEAAILGLNEEQFFYLQSRGMNLKQAKDFLLKSFLKS